MSEKKGSISIREKKRQRAGYSLIAPACLVLLVIFLFHCVMRLLSVYRIQMQSLVVVLNL